MSLSNAILGLLSFRSMTGYEIKQFFDASIKNIWPAHLSQIYRELGNLESKGNVSSQIEAQETRPDRRVYTLTEQGRKDFIDWMNSTPQNFTSIMRDETALRMFFGSAVDKDELIFQLKTLLKEKRATIIALDHIGDTINQSSYEKDKKYWLLSLRKGYRIAEAELAWAEECIRELERMK